MVWFLEGEIEMGVDSCFLSKIKFLYGGFYAVVVFLEITRKKVLACRRVFQKERFFRAVFMALVSHSGQNKSKK